MNFSDIHIWGLENYLEGNERFDEKLDRFHPNYVANLGGRREAVNSIFSNSVQNSCRTRTESEQPSVSVEDIHYEDSSSRNVTDQCAPSPPPGFGADHNRIGIHDNTPNVERKHRKTKIATNIARRLHTKFAVNLNPYRVSQPRGSKDRHSKVCTSKGPRDRRMRLSVETAIKLYDLQDRLGFDQPSKTVEWLLQKAKAAIRHLSQPSPIISDSFLSADSNTGAASLSSLQSETLNSSHENLKVHNGSELNFISAAQSFPASTTESNSNPDSCVAAAVTPKGESRRFTNTGVVLSRRKREVANPTMLKENRAKARERARERTSQKMSTKQNQRFHAHALQSLAENPTPCSLGFENNGLSSSMKFMSRFNEDALMLPQESSFLSATDIEIQNSSIHCPSPSSPVKDSGIQSILSQTSKQSPPKVTTHSLQNTSSRYSLDECGLPFSRPSAFCAGFTVQNPVSLISGIEFLSECQLFHSMQDLETGCVSPGEFVQPEYSDAFAYTAVSSSPIPPYPTSEPLLDCSYYVTDFPLDI